MRRHRHTTAALLLAAGLALTGCSTDSSDQAAPEPAATVTTTAAPELTKTEITERCIAAVADRAANTTGSEVPFEPTPEPCVPLSESEYLDAYMDGLNQANQAILDEREQAREDAAEADSQ